MIAISPHIQFSVSIHFCCFHRENRLQIVEGFKRKITEKEAMTGPEFCNLLGIDYTAMIARRREHQQKNFDYFIDSLLEMPPVLEALGARMGGAVGWDEDEGGEAIH